MSRLSGQGDCASYHAGNGSNITLETGPTPLMPERPEWYAWNERKGGRHGPSSAQAARCPPPLGAVAPLVAIRIAAVDARREARAYGARARILTRSKSASVTFRAGALAVSGVARLPVPLGRREGSRGQDR